MRWNGIQTGMERWIQKVRQCSEESLIGKAGSERWSGGSRGEGEVLTEGMMRRHVEICDEILRTER